MGVPDRTYHKVSLPALGVELRAAFFPETQALWFPVPTVCEALHLQLRYWRGKVQREYKGLTDKFRLPTDGGPQEQLCIEWAALAHWLSTIQGEKTTSEETRSRLRTFRTRVMAAASLILQGQAEAIALVEAPRRRGGADLVESRLAQLERAVFVGEPVGDDDTRLARCPHCGKPIRISHVDLEAIPEDDEEEPQ